jgi:hypothetical protein
VDTLQFILDGWDDFRQRVSRDDHPTKKELIFQMRLHGVPEDMGAYVANRLTSKAPRGAPSKNTPAGQRARFLRAYSLQLDVFIAHAYLLLEGKSRAAARGLAIEAVARRHKPRRLSPDRLRDILKEGRRIKAAELDLMWPKFPDVRAYVNKRAAAQARLDRMRARKKKR